MPSALLPRRNSGSPPRFIRTLIGRGNNRPSLRATPPCSTSLLSGRQPYQTTVVFPFSPAPLLLGDPGACWQRPAIHHRRRHRPARPPTDLKRPAGRAACLLNDEPIRIYAPLLMCPWVMQACHLTASCHLGTTRTLRMLERFCWWIGMNICTRWLLRHCLKCQARNTSRLMVR